MNKQEWCFSGNQVRTLKGGLVTINMVTEDNGVRCSDGLYWCRTELEPLTNGLNGYKYGVEYPTNGKKPDLSDDIVIGVNYSSGTKADGWTVGETSWEITKSFRIVDERYKPKETAMPKQNTGQDNSWFEKGEFPPVGWHGEVTWGEKTSYHECVVLPNNRIAYYNIFDWVVNDVRNLELAEFRPVKSERERYVEAAFQSLTIDNSDLAYKICQELYDSGYLKMPDENRSA